MKKSTSLVAIFASLLMFFSVASAQPASASIPVDVSGTAGHQSVRLTWSLSTNFPFSFNGTTYNEVFIGSNSYLTFGAGSTAYSGLGTSNPSLPGVHVCAGDWSYEVIQYKINTSVTPNQLRVRFQGTASRYSNPSPNMIFEAVFYRDMSYFDLLIGTNSACANTSSKLITNGSSSSTPVAFSANTSWRISGLSATQNGHTAVWDGSSSAGVAANSNGWTATNSYGVDDGFVSSRLQPSSYLVQASSNGGVTWGTSVSTSSSANSYTYGSLTNGVSYVFRVAPYFSATGATGTWSNASPVYVPMLVPPGQPTSLTAVAGNGRATLSWVAPTVSGDSSISGYRIEYSSNGGVSWQTASSNTYSTSTSSWIVNWLTNGLSYTFRVAAINSSSTGSYSATATAIPATVPPGQPTSLTAVAGNGRATLSWVAPTVSGDSSISGYRIEYSSNGGVSWQTATSNSYSSTPSHIVNWITNGTPYVFRVAAVNSSSTGVWSAISSPITPRDPDLPLAPTSVFATPGDGQVVLSWTSVSARYFSGYRIEYSINGGSSWWTVNSNTYSSATTRTIIGLENGKSYMFRVAAVDSYSGRGDFKSVTVVPAKAVASIQNNSKSSKSVAPSKKTATPVTRYVARTFTSGNTRMTLKAVLTTAKISVSGQKSLSGSVVSYNGAPCRVSGGQLLRDDKESSCVLRITLKKTDRSTLIATVTVEGVSRMAG